MQLALMPLGVQVMKHNNSTLPPQALFIIRYHSFYGMNLS
jgi:hypothetical protein